MKQVWQTADGKVFSLVKAAKKHEKLLEEILQAKRDILPKKFDNTNFTNGSGYIQLTEEQLLVFNQKLNKLIGPNYKLEITGRRLCDSDSPVYRLWSLLKQIDERGRLWGQPYFVSHQNEAKNVRLNK